MLPFLELPPRTFSKNNRSALDNFGFVSEAISELILNGTARQVSEQPYIVSPLSVAFQSSGAERLILDLSFVNSFLRKKTVKFEDLRIARQYFVRDGFIITWDIKKGYHHVPIAEAHYTYLGFCWPQKGKNVFYVFTCLPFGLSTAPYVFTKLLRPLVAHWRAQGIPIVVYIDDGFL